jgi:hypothetical protein
VFHIFKPGLKVVSARASPFQGSGQCVPLGYRLYLLQDLGHEGGERDLSELGALAESYVKRLADAS